MTDASDPALEALLAEARAQFAGSLPAKTAELEGLLARSAWADARRAAHRLRGSCGTYGFPSLSAAAGAIEDHLLEAGGAPGDAVLARIRERLAEIVREGRSAAGLP